MPDISKCTNKECDKKQKCYRYTSTKNTYQPYAQFDEKDCEYFIDNN